VKLGVALTAAICPAILLAILIGGALLHRRTP
jgi:hypothetical protein